MPDPRTFKPNGPMIEALRKMKGWSRDYFSDLSNLLVLQRAKTETPKGFFHERYASTKIKGRCPGISTGTLASAEKSKPVFPKTLRIIAATLGVPMNTLIHPQDPFYQLYSPTETHSTQKINTIKEIIDNLTSKARESMTEAQRENHKLELLRYCLPSSDNKNPSKDDNDGDIY